MSGPGTESPRNVITLSQLSERGGLGALLHYETTARRSRQISHALTASLESLKLCKINILIYGNAFEIRDAWKRRRAADETRHR